MTFDYAVMVASDYWAKRHVTVPCHPKEHLLTEAATADWGYSVDMLADVPHCTVDITPWAEWWRTDPDNESYYCKEIVHEVGHLAGLEHDYGGVMDHDQNVVPWGCDHPRQFLVRKRQMHAVWMGVRGTARNAKRGGPGVRR